MQKECILNLWKFLESTKEVSISIWCLPFGEGACGRKKCMKIASLPKGSFPKLMIDESKAEHMIIQLGFY